MTSRELEVYRVEPIVLFVASVLAIFSYLECSFPPPAASGPSPKRHSVKKRTRKNPEKKQIGLIKKIGAFWVFFSGKNQENSHIGNGATNGARSQQILDISPTRTIKEQLTDSDYKGIKLILSPKNEHIVHCFKGNFAYLRQPEFSLSNKLKEEEVLTLEISDTPSKDFPKTFEAEVEKYRRQAKREAELRVAAEDNLRFCEAQLSKERERVKSLEQDIHILQSKVVSFKKQKREESKIARDDLSETEEVVKMNGAVGAVSHLHEDSREEKMNEEILSWQLADEQYEAF
jgi:hypothetical protein